METRQFLLLGVVAAATEALQVLFGKAAGTLELCKAYMQLLVYYRRVLYLELEITAMFMTSFFPSDPFPHGKLLQKTFIHSVEVAHQHLDSRPFRCSLLWNRKVRKRGNAHI